MEQRRPLLPQSGHFPTEFQCPLLEVKRTSVAPSPMSAFDPKRTFRLRILTSIKFKVIAHKLSSITDWLSEKPAPVTVSARLLLPPPDPLTRTSTPGGSNEK